MYARTTTVRGDPSAMDEGIAHVRDVTWAELQHMSGCVGLSMLAERDAGRCIVTSAWATDEAMRASAEPVKDLRRGAAEALRADRVDIEEWEIAILHRTHPAGDGACARVTWLETPGGNLDSVIDTFRMQMLPRMDDQPGFCSVSLMVDRMTGRAAAAVTYADRDTLMRSRDMGSAMREEMTGSHGVQVTEVAEFDLVLAHLRVPEMA